MGRRSCAGDPFAQSILSPSINTALRFKFESNTARSAARPHSSPNGAESPKTEAKGAYDAAKNASDGEMPNETALRTASQNPQAYRPQERRIRRTKRIPARPSCTDRRAFLCSEANPISGRFFCRRPEKLREPRQGEHAARHR